MRGTQRRNFQQIYDALESAGASLGIDGGTHTSGFGGRSLVEDLDLLLGLLAEILIEPTFPPEDVERLRAQLLTGLAIRAQDTGEMASLLFDQVVYANHPYRHPEDGFPETIAAISQYDLVDFHRRYFGPAGMVVVVVGAVEALRAVERVESYLGGWSNPGQPPAPTLPPVTPLEETILRKTTIAGKSQADIVLGVAGPSRSSPDYFAASLGNSILGQFGMGGRIGDAVREKAGLAYYAHSSLAGGLGPGPWSVSSGVDPRNVEQTIDLIRQEITRFTTERALVEELSDSQANFIGRLPLSLESNGGVAGALLNLERFNLGLDYYRRYSDLVKAVTVDDVLAAAQHYLHNDRLGVAVAGP
jgi:zinc protease